jgi:hypothetical protein
VFVVVVVFVVVAVSAVVAGVVVGLWEVILMLALCVFFLVFLF